MNKIILLLSALLSFSCLGEYSLPSINMPSGGVATWQAAGVNGGIPDTSSWVVYDVTQSPYNADNTGVSDASVAIQAAIDAAIAANPSGCIVYLPTGSYRIDTTLSVTATYNYDLVNHNLSLVLRGDGPDSTFINGNVSSGSIIAFDSGTGEQGFFTISSGTPARGDTTATLSSVSGLAVGQYITIRHDESEALIASGINLTGNYSRSQIVKITNIATSTITFTPALNEGFSLDDTAHTLSQIQNSGIEDLRVTNTGGGGQHNIAFSGCFDSWITNVESVDPVKWHIRLKSSAHCTLRNNYLHGFGASAGGGDSVYGFGLYAYCCDNLIENNIIENARHAMILERGGSNNVFGYNYSKDPINENQLTTDFLMGDISTHGGEPTWNLWEGNVASIIKWDSVLGGSQYNTAFRNQITRKGLASTIYACYAIDIQDYNYDNSLIGNSWETPPSGYSWGYTRNYGDDAIDTGDDAAVSSRTLEHGTYDLLADVTTWNGSDDQDLPDSLYLTEEPSWWDGAPWPSIGPSLADKFGENPAYREHYSAASLLFAPAASILQL